MFIRLGHPMFCVAGDSGGSVARNVEFGHWRLDAALWCVPFHTFGQRMMSSSPVLGQLSEETDHQLFCSLGQGASA